MLNFSDKQIYCSITLRIRQMPNTPDVEYANVEYAKCRIRQCRIRRCYLNGEVRTDLLAIMAPG